ncbi:MAG TPA: hypothetical protein VFI58_12715 [Xanthobacteraceae bacterium]|nr:hypothetical protein [Xanthobacteraceae bacterium]
MNKSLASKVVRTPDRVASKVAAADSRSRASKVVRTLDRVASKVAADSRSRASSLDSVNFSFYENPFPASRRDFFILISDAGSKYIMRETSLRFD